MAEVVDVNLNGVFHCIQAVLPDMVDSGLGRIVNIFSSSTHSGTPYMSHYVAAKSAVNGLTKSLALEYGPAGITVNAVPPGFIDTRCCATQRPAAACRSPAIIERHRCAAWASPKHRAAALPDLRRGRLHHRADSGRQRRAQHLDDSLLCDDGRMSTEPAHFRLTEGGAFIPTPFAQSHWGDDHLNGPAVVGWQRGHSKITVGLKTSCRLGSLRTCFWRHAMLRRRSTSEWCVTDDGCAARNAMWYKTAAPWRGRRWCSTGVRRHPRAGVDCTDLAYATAATGRTSCRMWEAMKRVGPVTCGTSERIA